MSNIGTSERQAHLDRLAHLAIVHAAQVLDAIVKRNPEDRLALERLIDHRVVCSEDMGWHPTVQVGHLNDDSSNPLVLGVLGLLNGVLGCPAPEGGELRLVAEHHLSEEAPLVGFGVERFWQDEHGAWHHEPWSVALMHEKAYSATDADSGIIRASVRHAGLTLSHHVGQLLGADGEMMEEAMQAIEVGLTDFDPARPGGGVTLSYQDPDTDEAVPLGWVAWDAETKELIGGPPGTEPPAMRDDDPHKEIERLRGIVADLQADNARLRLDRQEGVK